MFDEPTAAQWWEAPSTSRGLKTQRDVLATTEPSLVQTSSAAATAQTKTNWSHIWKGGWGEMPRLQIPTGTKKTVFGQIEIIEGSTFLLSNSTLQAGFFPAFQSDQARALEKKMAPQKHRDPSSPGHPPRFQRLELRIRRGGSRHSMVDSGFTY